MLIYVCMYICMYVYMYVHMYVCMYICMYIYIQYNRCEADVLNADDFAGGDCGVEGEEVCVCIFTERLRSESV